MKTKKLKRSKQETHRARWRRNKESERQRERERRKANEAPKKSVDDLGAEFLDQVWAERDKRERNFPMQMPHLPNRKFFKNGGNFASQSLVCDVWAAEVILAALNPNTEISDGEITRFLIEQDRTHGVKTSSLRTKVWRTRPMVRFLEEAPIWDRPGNYWPKFPESMPELGSGLKQHVDYVMASLGTSSFFVKCRDQAEITEKH